MSTNILESVSGAVKHWYLPLIIGLIMIGVGIWTMASPVESYLALSLIFSVTFLVSGFMEIIFSLSNREILKNWGWSLAFGILNVIVGYLLISNPEVSLVTLPFYVGFMLMFRSINAIGYSFDLKNLGVLDWGNLLLVGALGLLFSFILLWNPLFAGMTIVLWTGLAFFTAGIFAIYLSFKLKNIHKKSNEIKEKFE